MYAAHLVNEPLSINPDRMYLLAPHLHIMSMTVFVHYFLLANFCLECSSTKSESFSFWQA